MAQSNKNSFWIKLEGFSIFKGRVYIIRINETEFAVLLKSHVHKYNINKNKWDQTLKYAVEIDTPKDNSTNRLGKRRPKTKFEFDSIKRFIFDKQSNKFCVLTSSCISKYIGSHPFIMLPNDNVSTRCVSLLAVNGAFHLIGDYYSESRHYIFNTQSQQFKRVATFHERFTTYCSAHYVTSQNCILYISLLYRPRYLIRIWKYSLVSDKWKPIGCDCVNEPFVDSILTYNEQNIVLINKNGDIFVWNWQHDKQLKKCKLRIPSGFGRDFHLSRTGEYKNEILVNGFVKQLFQCDKFKELQCPPTYIIKLISNFYISAELIHVLCKRGIWYEHFAIDIKHIIANLCHNITK
eukprot:464215_1